MRFVACRCLQLPRAIPISLPYIHRSTFSTTYNMPSKDKYSDPKLRDQVKEDIKQSDKGGEPGQWSARKAQMMAKEYKKRGGDYNTDKSEKEESQKNLSKWGEEEWQTKEGSGDAKKDDGSRKRYLPKKAWEDMSEKEKKETDEKKQEESKKGKQHVGNTGKAKNARKNASKDSDKSGADSEQSDDAKKDNSAKENKSPSSSRKRSRSQQQDEEDENDDQDDANEDDEDSDSKKQKSNNGSATKSGGKSGSSGKGKKKGTVGSKHDSADAPAAQASVDRLPKKGQKAHWKALPGWVDGEVVEIVKSSKKVDGKDVKGSQKDPKIVLKSSKSGKICVHNVDNVYFD